MIMLLYPLRTEDVRLYFVHTEMQGCCSVDRQGFLEPIRFCFFFEFVFALNNLTEQLREGIIILDMRHGWLYASVQYIKK
jgi:hypothetical protein